MAAYKTLNELISIGEVKEYCGEFVYLVYDGKGNCLQECVDLSEAYNLFKKLEKEKKKVIIVRKAIEYHKIILLKEIET
jgi:hypothetical protein